MRLLRSTDWCWSDTFRQKWSVIMFGMVVLAFLGGLVTQYVWLLLGVALALAIKPACDYFGEV